MRFTSSDTFASKLRYVSYTFLQKDTSTSSAIHVHCQLLISIYVLCCGCFLFALTYIFYAISLAVFVRSHFTHLAVNAKAISFLLVGWHAAKPNLFHGYSAPFRALSHTHTHTHIVAWTLFSRMRKEKQAKKKRNITNSTQMPANCEHVAKMEFFGCLAGELSLRTVCSNAKAQFWFPFYLFLDRKESRMLKFDFCLLMFPFFFLWSEQQL